MASYICNFCNKSFKTDQNLQKHKTTSKICLKKQQEKTMSSDSESETVTQPTPDINETQMQSLLNSILEGQKKLNSRLNEIEINNNLPQKQNLIPPPVSPKRQQTNIPPFKTKHNIYIEEVKEKMRNHINLIVPENSFDFKNYLFIIVELIKFIENFYVSNIEKKNIVLDTFNNFIKDIKECDEKVEEEFKVNFEDITSSFIDIVISLDRKEMFIKEKKSGCCLPF